MLIASFAITFKEFGDVRPTRPIDPARWWLIPPTFLIRPAQMSGPGFFLAHCNGLCSKTDKSLRIGFYINNAHDNFMKKWFDI